MEIIVRENENCSIRIIECDGGVYQLVDDNTSLRLFYERINDAYRKFGILTRNKKNDI